MKSKSVKKLTIYALLLVFCFILSACDPTSYYFTGEDLADVISIELVDYDNPEQKSFGSWVFDRTSDLKPFDNSKMSQLEILAENKIFEFVDSLCECCILEEYFAFDSPNGICIKINYSNGDFMIIWSNYKYSNFSGYIGRYSPDGEVTEFIGCFEGLGSYINLVNNYFQTQI